MQFFEIPPQTPTIIQTLGTDERSDILLYSELKIRKTTTTTYVTMTSTTHANPRHRRRKKTQTKWKTDVLLFLLKSQHN